ncbi:unnamed protein product, partial [Amoebophrya sp. A25]
EAGALLALDDGERVRAEVKKSDTRSTSSTSEAKNKEVEEVEKTKTGEAEQGHLRRS